MGLLDARPLLGCTLTHTPPRQDRGTNVAAVAETVFGRYTRRHYFRVPKLYDPIEPRRTLWTSASSIILIT